MVKIGIVGTGYVADLYMQSFAVLPAVAIIGATDAEPDRRARFARHWNVAALDDVDALIAAVGEGGLILNLTNPSAHFEISLRCLEAGVHVYSEKPLALELVEAQHLCDVARENGLLIASAPCSVLGESAQLMAAAVRAAVPGRIRLVYAELDDDYVSQAPYDRWSSRSGIPWPSRDEFEVGCTIEHAGYYLTWLIAMFGSVESLVAVSACLAPDQMAVDRPAPDFSVATLFFESGVVARLTCSILAPHNHGLVVIGDKGVLEVDDCWDNAGPVRFRRRFPFRRKLVTSPISQRLRFPAPTHPKPPRFGAASMNFGLGPLDLAEAIAGNHAPRLTAEFALHVTEVTLAIHAAGNSSGIRKMETRCSPVAPMPWATHLRRRPRWPVGRRLEADVA